MCSNYDYKQEGRLAKVLASIKLVIKIIKKDVKAAEAFVKKGLVSILTPIMMEIEIQTSDSQRFELIRSTSKLFAELTELQNNEILVSYIEY